MLGKRSAQLGMFEADHLHLGHVGEDTFYGFLARQRGELFCDEDFADFSRSGLQDTDAEAAFARARPANPDTEALVARGDSGLLAEPTGNNPGPV